MRTLTLLAICFLVAMAPVRGSIPSAAEGEEWGVGTGPNLVRNPGFEEIQDGKPTAWRLPAPVYSSGRATARSGRLSLKYVNDDPKRYLLCMQPVALEPGGMYEIKAWVKTRGIKGDGSGATLCLEWQDADGKWMGGHFPTGRKGDTPEWTEVGGTGMRVPPDAASAHVTCYVRRGMTGTAWWDDVSVRRVRQRPLYSLLVSPSYRGWILDEGPDHADVRISFVWHDVEGGPQAHRVEVRLTPAGRDETIVAQSADALPPDQLRLRLPLPDLTPGSYRLKIDLVNRETGQTVYEDVHRLERRTGPMPECFVDENNRLIVAGEPFFPLGMYWSGVNEEQLRTYAEGPFNCLMPYGRPSPEQMDLIDGFGLKVIYSIKDFYHGTRWHPDFIKSEADEEGAVREWVREFRDHPALLAWYINDELPLSMLPRLEAHQRWVEEEDAGHPTWVVLYQVGDVACYVKSFDVIGTDPYPIPGRPAAMAGEWARLTREAVEDARALWMVPQVFNKAVYQERDGRAPTFDEIRSMTWQCITEGADGIIFYSWFDLWRDQAHPFEERWPDLKRVAREVKEMIPVLLSVEPTPGLEVDAPDAVHWTVRRDRGTVYLFMVNDGEESVEVTVHFAQRPRGVTMQGREFVVSPDGRLTVGLAPLGVDIYRIEMSEMESTGSRKSD